MNLKFIGGMDPKKMQTHKSSLSFDAWLRLRFIKYNPPADFFAMPWYMVKVFLRKIINE